MIPGGLCFEACPFGRFPEFWNVSQTPFERLSAGRFPTTHWSRVIAAGDPDGPGARESLGALCTSYWYPLYAYIRRRGHTPEQAQDLTQDFFTWVLERELFAKADPERGRFRAFLRAVCARYLCNQHEWANARKRGGGRLLVSIDALEAEGRYASELADESTPERIFDRTWALTLLDRVLDQLRREYDDAGRGATFDELRSLLVEGSSAAPYATIAARLNTTEGAVRVAAHRLRRRYGMLLRREIAATVDDPAEIDGEIRALFAALQA
jgi:RNA polymerase sigma-70 factor (ECF subfamily)